MIYDVIIIGAGAAGLFSALSVKFKKVLLIEKNTAPGQKLLISGAGQCNYTNNCNLDEFLKRYGNRGRFLKSALFNLSNIDTIEFFDKHGVKSFIREDEKVFPESLKAEDILNTLIFCCRKSGVEFIYDSTVENVMYHENKFFTVKTSKSSFSGHNVIIATGGKSYPNTGSTGDGYKLAQNLGHKIEKPTESLTPVYTDNYGFKDIPGISFKNISVTLWRNNKKINEFRGDFLFTHVSISGPVILNNSRYMEKGDILKINFTTFKNSEEFKKDFENLILASGKINIKTALRKYDLPKRFIEKIMGLVNADEEIKCSQLDKNKRKKLIELISNYPFKIEKLGGFHVSMVTKGGVSTEEINTKTMESKIIPHLYFAGEVIDYDGDTGGFNIQAAFSTAKLAADAINKNLG
ncbi:NAD(P)/FAD-dependent oxidoreductase [Sedimentibacter hydroxybenzoicus DSM 7310]|uniref:NAD(P)/FAD-dependent oxidoreductase n=1 Tax=Sedimentibacter hydroxybenzoicus DSM 7310 TaxID=1123245 RepID=A0A974BKZ3_SEDHY|nr:NAD(P)/FAD-dependent oxidoreductase [Sedimentibacter hydroxybenzoicus]NYB74570.1 NAD(P)/FAD-dependent oxidoreductase [Sedimentibacter hydroxybenzoicus DSM 7310]